MEDLVPAQWFGEEDTSEPNLREQAKLVISTGKSHAWWQMRWTLGCVFLVSPPLSFWTSTLWSSLGGLLPFPSQSMWFVWVNPKPWLQGGSVAQVWPEHRMPLTTVMGLRMGT